MQRMIWTVLLIAAAGAALGAPERKAMLINSFETPEDIGKVTARSVRVAGVGDHATEGQQALKVEFEKAEWPSAYFDAGGRPWDWREYGFLALDIYNPMEEEITFAVRVDDAHLRHADAVIDSDLKLALRLARIEAGATHRHELTVTS